MPPKTAHERSLNPEQLRNFIDIYQQHPCLWQTKSADYSNRNKKHTAYQALADYCKTFYPNANIWFVKSKISNIRTVYKKELQKVEGSKRSGSGTDDVYVPRLWYYELLSFLNQQDVPRDSRSSLMRSSLPAAELTTTTTTDDSEHTEGNTVDESDDISFETQENTPVQPEEDETPVPSSTTKNKRKRNNNGSINTQQVINKLIQIPDDECAAYAHTMALKLRKLTEGQRRACEMIMNDCIFKAELQQLNEMNPRCIFAEHCIYMQPHHQPPPPPPMNHYPPPQNYQNAPNYTYGNSYGNPSGSSYTNL